MPSYNPRIFYVLRLFSNWWNYKYNNKPFKPATNIQIGLFYKMGVWVTLFGLYNTNKKLVAVVRYQETNAW